MKLHVYVYRKNALLIYVYNINANFFFFNFAARGNVSNHEKNSLVNLF